MLPQLGVSNTGKSTELVAAVLWDRGLDPLGLDKSLGSLGTCTRGLGIVGLRLLQTLPVYLGNTHVPQELGFYLLRDSYLCD